MNPVQTRVRVENEILSRLEERFSEEELANLLMSLLLDNYPLRSGVLLGFDGGTSPLVVAHRGLSGNFIKDLYTRGVFPLLEAASSGEIVLQGDDPRLSDPAWRMEHACRGIYAAPCRLQGETLGVFVADSDRPDLFAGETRQAFLRYARLGAILLHLRSSRGKTPGESGLDTVTGLHDFKFFHEVLHREITRGRKFRHPVSLVFIKIRFLRQMNEVHGHLAADRALVELVGKIRESMREVDQITRSGGMIYNVMPQTGKEEAAKTAEKIVAALEAAPKGLGNIALKVAIGVATYPKDGDTERVLIPHAESMVHESVRKGGNAVSVFRD